MIFVFIGLLLRIAFVTLLEQKILRFSQLRVGPQKRGIFGLLQPFADGVGLFTSEPIFIRKRFNKFFLISPMGIFFAMLMASLVVLSPFTSANVGFSFLWLMAILSVIVYFFLVPMLFGTSKYRVLGGNRALMQRVSYEVSFFIVLLRACLICQSFHIRGVNYPVDVLIGTRFFLLAAYWLIISLAEIGRAPFDFMEGESELVSGFNTEYGSAPFALLFIGEYGFLIVIRTIFIVFFGVRFTGLSLIVLQIMAIVRLFV